MRKYTLVLSIVVCLVSTVVYFSPAAETPIAKKEAEPLKNSKSVTIYDNDSSHLWNRLHAAIFVRTMDDGQTTGHDTVDPLLWQNTTEHLLKGESHTRAIRILDEFLENRGEKMIDKPLPRAVLQHDLWAVYDWAATRSDVAPETSRALRVRLARAIERLALSTDEIKQLPDNYAHDVKSGKWPVDYDPKGSGTPFLPPDLFDEQGPWVCISGHEEQPGSMVHLTHFRVRSAFLAFMQLPGGRKATLAYLEELNKKATEEELKKKAPAIDRIDSGSDFLRTDSAIPAFPVGTRVALVRRMLLIDQSGKIVPSAIVQSIQMRVYVRETQKENMKMAEQEVHKFKITRSALLSEEATSMKPVGPQVKSRFGLLHNREELRGSFVEIKTCVQCHSPGFHNIGSVYTFNQGLFSDAQNVRIGKITYPFAIEYRPQLNPVKIEDELNRTIRLKTSRNDWSMLRGTWDALSNED